MKQEFLKMYDSHVDAIFRYCYKMTNSRDEARMLTELSFKKMWDYYGITLPKEEVATTLRAIATRLMRHHSAKYSKFNPRFTMNLTS